MRPGPAIDADLLDLAEFARSAAPSSARLSFHSKDAKTVLIIELVDAPAGRSAALADSLRTFRLEKGLEAEFIIINATPISMATVSG